MKLGLRASSSLSLCHINNAVWSHWPGHRYISRPYKEELLMLSRLESENIQHHCYPIHPHSKRKACDSLGGHQQTHSNTEETCISIFMRTAIMRLTTVCVHGTALQPAQGHADQPQRCWNTALWPDTVEAVVDLRFEWGRTSSLWHILYNSGAMVM